MKPYRHSVALTPLLCALALGFGAAAANAQSASDETYLEALGSSLAMQEATDVQNPFGGSAPAQVKPEAASGPLTHDGNISRASNVPVPGQAGTNVASNPSTAPAEAQPSAMTPQSVDQAQLVAGVAPLPDPRIGPTATLLNIPQELINKLAPADAAQLRQVLQELHFRQGAAMTPPTSAYATKATQHVVDLSPGATPPVIRVAKGIGATINFVDARGNPWPVEFANNFHSEAASVTQMAPHVLSVTSRSPHLMGSVGVMLKDLSTPVNFIVAPAQDATEYRADLVVPGISPDAPPLIGSVQSRPAIGQEGLTDYLYGATPEGAKRLKVTGTQSQVSNTRAWQDAQGNLILRTKAQVVSPGWYDMLPALDGTAVYRLTAAPVVRVSVNGKIETFTIEGLTPKVGTVAKK